ncbi:hypothetical protein BCR33DRAFT_852149 [Rhizoclosmatium globosum]|uniref:PCIF1 WW domain-containing protein n=1 Tax=Rhizoclosmatium globosum TaxID=329046 RepID=A0A1Y2C3L6_9FUNG|nr:hypothetical protein BCR33DRAFT_852149 [Rhizoclosmatium globosum]|eukprot:ORY41643.1 hypothetical protein BCR33DRAFT_852149 [Rhizoclosmatium globosum]
MSDRNPRNARSPGTSTRPRQAATTTSCRTRCTNSSHSSTRTSTAREGTQRRGREGRRLGHGNRLVKEIQKVLFGDATSATPPNLKIEEKRQALDRRLRRKFKHLLLKHELAPPIQAFERWIFNAQSSASAKQRKDPLLPFNILTEENLVGDLVRAGISEKDSKTIVKELGKESTSCVQELLDLEAKLQKDGAEEEQVVITHHATSVDVTFGKNSFCKLSPQHYTKLQYLFKKYSEKPESEFPKALLALLLRYKSLLGHGFQAALSNVSFNVLNREFGVDFECFASPLNSRWGRHCSAFLDTDAAFGSLGDFFGFKPWEGSFQVNPPFVRPIMEKAARHVIELLDRAQTAKKALSFVVIIPGWEECECWGLLKGSSYLKDKYRPSPYPTGIFFVQTEAGSEKWPVTERKIALLRYAMMSSLPKQSEAARRLRAGRGYSSIDGGGGVYKGKTKNKRVWSEANGGEDEGDDTKNSKEEREVEEEIDAEY